MPYTTAQLDSIIAKLESSLGKGYAEVTHEGKHLVYRSVTDIRTAIAYFKALYDNATDAPAPAPKVRTFLFYGNKGFGL
ncbi:MAG TPA: hypothetical protein VE820_03660 [Sphingomicrobium sp.]|jgi:ABC-type transporter Mla maintaining outer membrane lipid asymmetry ATPase subunit MlaF|nr:hypothetical protein [Sphingomicrobium sp.]